MLKEEHYPIIYIFNLINDKEFINRIKTISEGIGFSCHIGGCIFPKDLDEYDIICDQGFDGVEIFLHTDEDIILTYGEFYYYLQIISEKHLLNFPKDKDFIVHSLEKFSQLFNIS